MTNSLNKHPIGDGTTSYCTKDFGNVGQNLMSLEKAHKFGSLGLPEGVKSPATIADARGNILTRGGPLPEPYGYRDNARMQLPFIMNGYGKKRSGKKRKSKSRKGRKSRKLSRKSRKGRKRSKKLKSLFGNTPGTDGWKTSAAGRNIVSNIMNNAGNVSGAVGFPGHSVKFYEGLIKTGQSSNVIGGINLPANFTNNQMNSPYFNFSRKKRKIVPRKRHFGDSPNIVGYEAPMPIYHAGANTINFATGQNYRPNILNNAGSVMPDGVTSNAWLTQSKGIGKQGFGGVYNMPTNPGTGNNVVQQPAPSLGLSKVTGSKMGYGKKNLSASFGGSVITLEPSGKVVVSTGK